MPRGRSDDSATGGTAARRRRSRSPLRAVSKKSKSLLGNLTKKPKDKVPDLSLDEPPAAKVGAAQVPKTITPATTDEDETVYGVVLDKGTKALPPPATPPRAAEPASKKAATPSSAASKKSAAAASPAKPAGPPLQVVLLLMDPKTRRFELLQLEFDSDKAVVADVLSQISLSATEESLRTQKYGGVADRTGAAKKKDVLLSSFCKANDVILAIPDGMKSAECSKLARPILGDPKVINMLNPNAEAPLSPVKEEPKSAEKPRSAISSPSTDKPAPSGGGGGGVGILTLLFPVLLALIVYKLNEFVTSPLKPGDVLAPFLFRSKCGVLSVLPESMTGCEPALVKMGDDGILTMYKGGEVVWEMKGAVCKEDDESCVPGATLGEDGKVTIAGSKVKQTGKKDELMSPWPFSTDGEAKGGFFF